MKLCKLRTIVGGDRFEYLSDTFTKLRKHFFQGFLNGLCRVVSCLDPDTVPGHPFRKCHYNRFVLSLFSKDRIDLSMTEFGSEFHDFRAFFDACA